MKDIQHCHVTVMVSNMDQAIDFYVEKMGLSLLKRYQNHYAEIQAPGLTIGLHLSDRDVIRSDNFSIGFGVADFEKALEELRENGIEVEVVRDGWSNIAHFCDQDQNPLYMVQYSN